MFLSLTIAVRAGPTHVYSSSQGDVHYISAIMQLVRIQALTSGFLNSTPIFSFIQLDADQWGSQILLKRCNNSKQSVSLRWPPSHLALLTTASRLSAQGKGLSSLKSQQATQLWEPSKRHTHTHCHMYTHTQTRAHWHTRTTPRDAAIQAGSLCLQWHTPGGATFIPWHICRCSLYLPFLFLIASLHRMHWNALLVNIKILLQWESRKVTRWSFRKSKMWFELRSWCN